MTDTQMTVSIIDSFKKTGQAINTPEGVAQYIVGLEIDPKVNGKAVYGKLLSRVQIKECIPNA